MVFNVPLVITFGSSVNYRLLEVLKDSPLVGVHYLSSNPLSPFFEVVDRFGGVRGFHLHSHFKSLAV